MTEQVTEELRPFPWGWYVGLVAVTAVALAVLWAGFDSVPDPMPVHWGPGGQPDSFVDRSMGAIVGLVGLAPAILVVTGLGSTALIRSQAREEGFPRRSARELNRRRLAANLQQPALGALLFGLGTLIVAAMTGSLLGRLGGATMSVLLIGGLLVLLGWFFLHVRRIGEHLDEVYPPENPRERLRWGMFYFNPGDERTVIDLEGGSPTTFNFARPGAWGILAALLAPMVILVVLAVTFG